MKKFTMKRLPALLIMLAVVSGAQADNITVTIGNLWYMLNTADNTATVSATTESISGAFTIPEKVSYNGVSYAVTSVGKDCFISCKNLESVVIPNSVKSLGYASFQGCTSLVSVTIGSNVTEIGWHSFKQCKALKSISIPDAVETIGVDAFAYCDNLETITFGVNTSSLKEIGMNAFEYCKKLDNVVLPNSLTTMGKSPFEYCTGLTSITLSDKLSSVSTECFKKCTNLESIVIPNSVKSLGSNSFWDCTNLVSVTIGSNVTEIGGDSFWGCKALKSITSLAVTPPTCLPNDYKNVDCFSGVDKTNCLLTVPDGSLNAYKSADPWKKFYKIEETTAIEAVSAAKAKVYAAGERIVVEGVSADAKVNIIDTAGRTVYAGKGDTSVNAPAHGIYIVRVDGASVKVAL